MGEESSSRMMLKHVECRTEYEFRQHTSDDGSWLKKNTNYGHRETTMLLSCQWLNLHHHWAPQHNEDVGRSKGSNGVERSFSSSFVN